jgi:hypothetical protein
MPKKTLLQYEGSKDWTSGNTGISIDTEILIGKHTTEQVSGNYTINLDKSNIQNFTLVGNTVFGFENASVGSYVIILNRDGDGNRSVSFPSTIKWSGGQSPTYSTGANQTDIVTFIIDGNNSIFGIGNTNFSVII